MAITAVEKHGKADRSTWSSTRVRHAAQVNRVSLLQRCQALFCQGHVEAATVCDIAQLRTQINRQRDGRQCRWPGSRPPGWVLAAFCPRLGHATWRHDR